MFNMENTGRKISELRKAKNMTQMELADALNISFQAVSNWERGNTMPDISKLPELAEIFGVTIDELLGKQPELTDKQMGVIYSAVEGKLGDYLSAHEVTAEDLKEVAPLLKPDQADEVFESVCEKDGAGLSDIEELLPFIGSDMVDKIARRHIENGESIAEEAPFVSRGIIAELAEKRYGETGRLSSLDDFAPFIPRPLLRELAEKEFAAKGLRDFESIAPFLDRELLRKYVAEKYL